MKRAMKRTSKVGPIIFSAALTLFVLATSCDSVLNIDIVGDGNRVKVNREVKAFTEVYLDTDFRVVLTSGATRQVQVECDSNLLAYVITEVENNRLTIGRKTGFNLMPRQPVQINLVVPSLTWLDVVGGGEMIADGLTVEELFVSVMGVSTFTGRELKCTTMEMFAEGSTRIRLHGTFRKFTLRQKGSGEVELTGGAKNCELLLEGSGKIDASGFIVPFSTTTLYGSGLVFCYASEVLDVRIDGNGRVYYYGEPLTLKQNVKGNGLILPGEQAAGNRQQAERAERK